MQNEASLRQALASQTAQAIPAIERHFPPGVQLASPRGGYFVWIALPPGVNALALHRQALARGISIAPGPIFSATRGFNRCIRLNTGHPWSDAAERAVATLGGTAAGAAGRPVSAPQASASASTASGLPCTSATFGSYSPPACTVSPMARPGSARSAACQPWSARVCA